MAPDDIELVRELIALQAPMRAMPLADRRQQYERAETAFGGDIAPGEVVNIGGCAAEWVVSRRDPAQPLVVYLHGGGYCLGSPRSHRHLAAAIGRAAGAAVLSIDYSRAPEFAFPSAVDDAIAATRWLLEHTDAPIAVAGDSAGGGLTIAAMIALRDAGLSLPAAGVCLSPWVDLTCNADAHTRLADRDPLLSSAALRRMAASYLRGADPHHPLASPAFANLSDLPPLLIQVGTDEILLDDARALARAARAVGVEVTLEEWSDMIHTWHWYFPVLYEGRQAIDAIGAFIRRHTTGERSADDSRQGEQERIVPASLIQEAHLLLASSTTGRGYLSWVYQLNGQLDVRALAHAVDDVLRRHEILRTRFERRAERLYQVVAPFAPGALNVVDLSTRTKQEGLSVAIDDIETAYRSLSPAQDPRFRATLYTIAPKASVLAMFVAEALVDSDSGSLVTAEIARVYAELTGATVPAGLPAVTNTSYLDYVASHPPDPAVVARAREHWARQAGSAPVVVGWPMTAPDDDADGSRFAFALTPEEWARVACCAQALKVSPYVFALTCLQVALALVADVTHTLMHSIVSERSDSSEGMIGNFHRVARIDMRLDPAATFRSAAARTATAVYEAVEHSVVPAPLSGPETLMALPSGDPLPGIRFYMFANHEGPVFAGIRRRRFRLHGVTRAPLSVSCIYGPKGRQDFVFSSATAPHVLLERLATSVRAVVDAAVKDPTSTTTDVSPGLVAVLGGSKARTRA